MQWPGDEDEGQVPETEGSYEAEEQLTLADDDEALPWLESDEDYAEEEGFDTRMILFAVLAVVLLAVILLFGWWYFSERPDPDLAPDGSTIEAPEGPYKERPEDPGGTQVEGTGDLSYGVGEGQSRVGQIAGDAPAEAESGEGVGVQIGAFSSRTSAQSGWNQLRGRFEALQGLQYRILEGSADSGTIYRLQAVAANEAAADTVCRSIRNAGGDCQVKR